MNVSKEDVLEALGRNTTRGMSLTAIADAIGARKQDYARLRKVIGELVEAGTLANLGAGLYGPPRAVKEVKRKEKPREPDGGDDPPRQAKLPWGGAPSVKPAAPPRPSP